MARDIKLSDLRKKRERLAFELAQLEMVIASVEAVAGFDEPSPRRRKNRQRPARKTETAETVAPPPQLPLNGFHATHRAPATVFDAVASAVESRPGIPVSELIGILKDQVETTAVDQRKLLSTRIAQFVKRGRLRREGDRIFLPSHN